MNTVDLKTFYPSLTINELTKNWQRDEDICFIPEDDKDDYRRQMCRIDALYPKDRSGLPVIVFFHGGGLTDGTQKQDFRDTLCLTGCVIISVGYRLAPKVEAPVWMEDAAEGAVWAVRHAKDFHGDPNNVFIAGDSAGAYLAAMLAADKRYLEKFGMSPDDFRGFIIRSGEVMTHFHIRQTRGIPVHVPVIDEYAPLNYIRKDFPPILLMTGGTGCDMDCRPAENKLMHDLLVYAGNTTSAYYELSDLGHGNVWDAYLPYSREFVAKYMKRN